MRDNPKKGERWLNVKNGRTCRIMSEPIENYIMARYKGGMPILIHVNDWHISFVVEMQIISTPNTIYNKLVKLSEQMQKIINDEIDNIMHLDMTFGRNEPLSAIKLYIDGINEQLCNLDEIDSEMLTDAHPDRRW